MRENISLKEREVGDLFGELRRAKLESEDYKRRFDAAQKKLEVLVAAIGRTFPSKIDALTAAISCAFPSTSASKDDGNDRLAIVAQRRSKPA